jgi:protein-disulfide isomerase/predicted GNAT family acetyltransferase
MAIQRNVRLSEPVSERDHSQGPANAPVTLVEYGDYQCPYSGRAHPIIKELQRRLGDRLRFVFRNFPLTQIHPHAEHAAEAAEAAAAQGRFWPMYDLLFAQQRALDDAHLAAYARQVGLDTAVFEGAMTAHTYAPRVREDVRSGVQSGVGGTPTFLINDTRHDDSYDLDTLLAAIERAEQTVRTDREPGEQERAIAADGIEVTNDEAAQRYEAWVDGALSIIQYERQGDRIVYLHTEVPVALEGRGIAATLARTALEDARLRNLTVVPLCPFVSGYIRRHPEYLALVDPAYRARLQ